MFTRSKLSRSEKFSRIQKSKQNYFITKTVNCVRLVSKYLYFNQSNQQDLSLVQTFYDKHRILNGFKISFFPMEIFFPNSLSLINT